VLGDPRVALAWLVNELSDLGIILRAGHLVTTGTALTPIPITEGDEVLASLGDFGELSVRFA
jgi:2-keto-4-pentenoate hydratase